MKAIFVTGGKQYYVSEGDTIYVEKLPNEVGTDVTFTDVLYVNGKSGNPVVKDAKVVATVEKHGRQKKIIVFKYRPKKKYRKKQGHKKKNQIEKVVMKGHAMYDDYGKDIVCAGVSSVVTTSVNAILKLREDSIFFEEGSTLTISVLKEDEITNALLENMIDLLSELAESYPKNIKIKEDRTND